MKKGLSLVIAFVLLIVGCLSAAIGENDSAARKEEETSFVLAWMAEQIPAEEKEQMLSWDRDTILEKLEAYDQPLKYTTKEEIADQLSLVIGLLGTVKNAAENSENGEELAALLGGLLGGALESGDKGYAGILGLLGGLMGGFGSGFDADFTADEENDGQSEGIAYFFDGTFWQCGDLKMEIVYQDGYYKAAVLEGDTELSYLCEYDEPVIDDQYYARLTGIGTGDEEMDAVQADHGKTVFLGNEFTNEVIWQRDGEELTFTRIIDPLDESVWVGNGKTLNINWLSGLNYRVTVSQSYDLTWTYECVLNEETDTLEGSGQKDSFSSPVYTDAKASFAFNENRTALTWTDDREPDAAEGVSLEAVPTDLLMLTWSNGEYALVIFNPDGFGRYDTHIVGVQTVENDGEASEAEEVDLSEDEQLEYDYLCTFDWETKTFTAMDPSTIDFDSLMIYADPQRYPGTATFSLQDADTRILWRDDSGLAGDGIVLERDF